MYINFFLVLLYFKLNKFLPTALRFIQLRSSFKAFIKPFEAPQRSMKIKI